MAIIMEVICLIAAMIACVVDSTFDISVPFSLFSLLYVAWGITYCITDIALLDMASLPRTEISLYIGYSIEMLGICLSKYIFKDIESMYDVTVSAAFYTCTGICLGVSMVLLAVVGEHVALLITPTLQ